ncbi:MAG TPA: hypothetical protein DDY91_14720 [Planctomycetaceae bacterium]|nr:hypothetical protein [Planctomycetaceae bacterium]
MNGSAQTTMKLGRLGEVARFLRGITFKPVDLVAPGTTDSVVCMRTKNIQSDLDQTDLIAVPKEFVRRQELYLQESDILVSTANSWELVGKCCWVPKLDYSATAGGFISVLRATPEWILPRYLYHWFNSEATQRHVRNCGRQTTNISNMSFERCEALQVPLPPLAEQKRIADILDKADGIRRKRREAVEVLGSLDGSAFLHAFGDPARNSSKWPIYCINQIATEMQYGTAEKANSNREGIPVVRMNNITYGGRIDLTDLKWCHIAHRLLPRFTLRRGDLLFNRTNSPELVGKTAVWDRDESYAYAGYLIRVRFDPERVLPEYVSAFLNCSFGKQLLFGRAKPSNNMSNLSATELGRLEIPVPPIHLQREFSNLTHSTDLKRSRLEAAACAADTLFGTVVQHAFRGQL